MGVQRLSPAAQATIAAGRTRLQTAVEGALKDVRKVQGRMTEELRAEDAIKDITLHGSEVHVAVDSQYNVKEDGLRALVKDLLKKHGAAGSPRVELHKSVSLSEGVDAANKALQKIQTRKTRETRVEDGIRSLFALEGQGVVSLMLKPHNPYDEKLILKAAKQLLADAGIKGVKIEVVRVAIEPIPPFVTVQRAMAAIDSVQQRLTTDMRAEDDIMNMRLEGGEVRVALRAHPRFDVADIKATALKHLEQAGYLNAKLTFIRPAIDPIRRPPGAPSAQPTSMKAKVEELAAHINTVHSRMTEELRIEDAVASVKVVGARVEVKFYANTAFTEANVKAFVKDELKSRGVQLPVTFKVKDPRDV